MEFKDEPLHASASEAITNNVRVEVESQFVPERSQPFDEVWHFIYTVRITNQGSADLVNINTSAVFPEQIAPVATAQGTVTGQTVKFNTVARLAAKGFVSRLRQRPARRR